MLTPWGLSTRVISLERGISFVLNQEHGGLILDREYAERKLSHPARKRGRYLGDSYAFEMDFALALVLWEIPYLRGTLDKRGMSGWDSFNGKHLAAILSRRFPDYLRDYWSLKSYALCRP